MSHMTSGVLIVLAIVSCQIVMAFIISKLNIEI